MLCIVGGGKMGMALAKGIVSDPNHDDLTIVEHNAHTRSQLNNWIQTSGIQRTTVAESSASCEVAVIAVKQKDTEIAVSDAVNAGAKRIVSIVAGITISKLHEWAGHGVPIVRAMPNICAMVGQSATVISGAATAHEEDLLLAEKVLGSTGTVVRIQEDQMDAATGLSGSGPGYVFMVAEAMIDAGVHAGLSYEMSRELALATISGAGAMLTQNPQKLPVELRTMVTSPAATTAAGLGVLEQRALRSAFIDAVGAATARSKELGGH